jgi:hypothetical protein
VLCPENYGRLCIREINGVLTVCFHKGSVSGYRRDASTVPLSGANAIEAQRILKELIKI